MCHLKTFQIRFRIPRDLFSKILGDLQAMYKYFRRRCDATGKPGLSTLQKHTAAIRMLAYGSSSDSIDENIRVDASTSLKTLQTFCNGIIKIYGEEYLRPPTRDECDVLMAKNAERGFPGMIASIDCKQWCWNKCRVAWKGRYHGYDG